MWKSLSNLCASLKVNSISVSALDLNSMRCAFRIPAPKIITLEKGSEGLGLSIVGGYGSPHGDLPIYVKTIFAKVFFFLFTVLLKSKLVRFLSALYWFAVVCAYWGSGGISFRSHRKHQPGKEMSTMGSQAAVFSVLQWKLVLRFKEHLHLQQHLHWGLTLDVLS